MLRSPTAASTALIFFAFFDAPLLAQSDIAADWKPHGRFIASYRYSDWNPGSLIGADYETTGLNIAVLELDLEHKLQDTLFLPRLPRFLRRRQPVSARVIHLLCAALSALPRRPM